jgi:hypothetical protein
MCIDYVRNYILSIGYIDKCKSDINNANNTILDNNRCIDEPYITPTVVVAINKPVPTIISSEIVYPTQKDTLFWCIYIIGDNYQEYNNIHHNFGIKELEIKYKVNDYFGKNVHKIKETNYKKMTKIAIQETLSELITNVNSTSMKCILALIMYFNVNIIIIDTKSKTMVEFISNPDAPTHVLYKGKYGKYSADITPLTIVQIQDLNNKYICLEAYNKPLRHMSSYKVIDLDKMIDKLDIDHSTSTKRTKTEIYEILTKHVKCIL